MFDGSRVQWGPGASLPVGGGVSPLGPLMSTQPDLSKGALTPTGSVVPCNEIHIKSLWINARGTDTRIFTPLINALNAYDVDQSEERMDDHRVQVRVVKVGQVRARGGHPAPACPPQVRLRTVCLPASPLACVSLQVS